MIYMLVPCIWKDIHCELRRTNKSCLVEGKLRIRNDMEHIFHVCEDFLDIK